MEWRGWWGGKDGVKDVFGDWVYEGGGWGDYRGLDREVYTCDDTYDEVSMGIEKILRCLR